MFLLKGHEDLRQDERVMQFFSLVNSLLVNDPETLRRNLAIQRFAVIPLSTNSVSHSNLTIFFIISVFSQKLTSGAINTRKFRQNPFIFETVFFILWKQGPSADVSWDQLGKV